MGVGVGVGVGDVLKEDRILSKSRCGISGLLAVAVILYCQYIIVLVPHCEHVGYRISVLLAVLNISYHRVGIISLCFYRISILLAVSVSADARFVF